MATATEIDRALAELACFYETLTPASLDRIDQLYAGNAGFKDPFNEVQGVVSIRRIFEHMFATVESPRFVVTSRFAGESEAVLGWTFHLSLRGHALGIRGLSHLRFDESARVVMHRDYWDPAEELYAHLPLLGPLVRLLQRKLSADAGRAGR